MCVCVCVCVCVRALDIGDLCSQQHAYCGRRAVAGEKLGQVGVEWSRSSPHFAGAGWDGGAGNRVGDWVGFGGGGRLRVRLGFSGHGLGWSLSFFFRCVNTFRTTGTTDEEEEEFTREFILNEASKKPAVVQCVA